MIKEAKDRLRDYADFRVLFKPEHVDDASQRLEHDIRRRLPLLHHPEELHDLHEALVVALLNLSDEMET